MSVAVVLAASFLLLDGCYYMQAASGHMEVMRNRRPVAEVIDDEATDEVLRGQLRMVVEARQFAVDELLLPENGSYQSYADLQRDFVVWNVFASPEFSLTPKTWCYPVVGCVAYRGYFSEEKARKKADHLARKGLDVSVGGVSAYSTLGRFDDPVLNTMMRWSDLRLVRTLFHELAHQKLYISGDSGFNESFATAVAEIGLDRWIEEKGIPRNEEFDGSLAVLQEEVRNLVDAAREELEELYASEIGVEEMRNQKKVFMDRLSSAVQASFDASGTNVHNWLAAPLNNARLVPMSLYEGSLPAFREIFSGCGKQLSCFYARSEELAGQEFEQRQESLASFGAAIKSESP